jgi:tetratricopeptide (TPR) repeat protein
MTTHSRASVLVPFLFSLLVFAQQTPMQRGLELFRQEKYEAALQQFRDAHHLHPADASIENFIGIIETRLGRIDEANTDYEAAANIDPKLPGPAKNLGFNYLSAGRYELAEKRLKTALALDGTDPSVHYYLAILYLSTSRSQDAIPHIQPAQSLLENDPETGFLAVKAALQFNASPEALKLLEALERRSALSVMQEYAIANLLTEKQMYMDAVARFRKLAEMQPASWESKYNLAIALLKAKQPREALTLLVPLAAERPKDANITAMLASAYQSTSDYTLALQAYQRTIASDPKNPDRYLDCTQMLMDLNRFDEAADILQKGISNVQDAYALTVRMGAIEILRGNHEKARDRFHEAIMEHPDIALGYVALAQAYMKEGNNEEALKVLTEGRKNSARDFALEYVFGLVSSQLGQQKPAMEALKSAEELGPTVVEPHYQLGVLYMQMQQWDNAQEEFQRILQLDPHHAATYYQLSRTYAHTGDIEKANQMAKEAKVLTQTQQEEALKAEQLRLSVPARH